MLKKKMYGRQRGKEKKERSEKRERYREQEKRRGTRFRRKGIKKKRVSDTGDDQKIHGR